MLTAQNRILFSETTRCVRQQWVALLSCLLLNLLNYCLCTRWGAAVSGVRSPKTFECVLLLCLLYSLNGLLLTTSWLLVTQATLQQRGITLLDLIKRTMQLFPKLVAVEVINFTLIMLLTLINLIFTTIIWALLLKGTETITVLPEDLLVDFFFQMLTSRLWICETLLPALLLIWYLNCRLFFTTYLLIIEPRATLLATLRLSWNWSRSRLTLLLVATLLLGLLYFIPAWKLYWWSKHTNPWVNIGLILYRNTLWLVSSIYFFVLYRQRSGLPSITKHSVDDAAP